MLKRKIMTLGVLNVLDGLLMIMSFGYWFPNTSMRYMAQLLGEQCRARGPLEGHDD